MNAGTQIGSSIDAAEVERFGALAAQWWDARGPFAPLHRFNPVRLAFIREQCLRHFARDGRARAPFSGLRLIDIGCGGGLLTEPMARLGFAVTGIDAATENVAAAAAHAERRGLAIDYRPATAESVLGSEAAAFDVVLNMEVIEHVADPAGFLRDCAALLAPGGLMILATLNRTARAFALGKVAAEHVLRWVPAGTHDWRRFLTPEEIRGFLRLEGLEIAGPFGVAYDPISGKWGPSSNTEVNYMMTIARPPDRIAAVPDHKD